MRATSITSTDFIEIALSNTVNAELLYRLNILSINQCHLTAGCLFQALWNYKSGNPIDWGINDYDVFYFDDSDLSEAAEDHLIQRVLLATDDLGDVTPHLSSR